MNATLRERCIYGNDVQIIARKDDVSTYKISDKTGHIIMISHNVFPGIELIYNNVHMHECSISRERYGNIIEINHCQEGMIECKFNNGLYYLSNGDVSITKKDDCGYFSTFPMGKYSGITISIDIDRTPDCLSCFLDDVNVQPVLIAQKFCNDANCYIMRSRHCLEHIFSEMYSVPECIKKGYFKVKILELLLFLSSMDIDESDVTNIRTKQQKDLAKNIRKYLMNNMDSHITIEQLSEIFLVSPTQLKYSFKREYESSIYSFIRSQKMHAAAIMIKNSNKTVLDIAGQFGYDNGSKFAKAFRDVMGVAPKEYRKAQNK